MAAAKAFVSFVLPSPVAPVERTSVAAGSREMVAPRPFSVAPDGLGVRRFEAGPVATRGRVALPFLVRAQATAPAATTTTATTTTAMLRGCLAMGTDLSTPI